MKTGRLCLPHHLRKTTARCCPKLPLGASCWGQGFQGHWPRSPLLVSSRGGGLFGRQSPSAPRTGMLKAGSRRNTRVKHYSESAWNDPLECSQLPPHKWAPETLTTPALQESDLRLPRAYRQPSLRPWGSSAPRTDSSPTPVLPRLRWLPMEVAQLLPGHADSFLLLHLLLQTPSSKTWNSSHSRKSPSPKKPSLIGSVVSIR